MAVSSGFLSLAVIFIKYLPTGMYRMLPHPIEILQRLPVVAVCTLTNGRHLTSLEISLEPLESHQPHQMHLRSVTTNGRREFNIYSACPG